MGARYTEDELRKRRRRQWYESRLRCGHATLCPVCGAWTRSRNGFCIKHGGMMGRNKVLRSSQNAKRTCKACGVEIPDGEAFHVVVKRQSSSGGWKNDRPSQNLCARCLAEVDKAVDEAIAEIRSPR